MVIFAGSIDRQPQAAIEYLQAANEVLKSQRKGRRITLTDDERRKLLEKRYLVMDRDGSFNEHFRGLLELAGVQPVRLLAQSPNCSTHLE